ncbi:MAG: hypothetical protein A3C85_03430 [Candidatus Doudnabacteria bacterium RIFCSPHIGHO2_02_FULL_48_21]|uniref:Uncharacterized protein n=1 Tax=Candidatus Doudnabacteria bacterium RIFCSPLOWO2_02_FULL_48_13 TaxID=1817845 RepID=A0A1F5QAY9_9BACT|nr:MAG: hypothetical protein A3K05_03690 [Candidatus Doudnabacteria bacterium RIFCSPHIGHO2_01_48_18]OGE77340.1 MAG: hypothetical protein A2668_01280 [Candidatus Doudnabacteria bacterium RIFCSPHIGHO2_01_FULL_48_180]OGE91294.1 MAG: hypothetical protein A3F44_03215 [Candidatus Doudnabacteria bacterium RIFCSPHIGHO2_12_FULL_47_25]OGE93292.1 MAG: hypothetical protein A3C85_03430 [Candidatus Doudnabacteria bacterium RIFCSPHIGHO2_02_FULL_48_21]OGE97802.1 MAG: hypothetical protein A3A83_04380 [Candidatu
MDSKVKILITAVLLILLPVASWFIWRAVREKSQQANPPSPSPQQAVVPQTTPEQIFPASPTPAAEPSPIPPRTGRDKN